MHPERFSAEKTGVKFIKICDYPDGTRVLRKELLDENRVFSFIKYNNFHKSNLYRYLNGAYLEDELIPAFGRKHINSYNIDLTTLDGMTDYKRCRVFAGLMTIDDFRNNRAAVSENFPNWAKCDREWWLATADSTVNGDGKDYNVRYVNVAGTLSKAKANCSFGVRPFLNLSSFLLVFAS